MGTNDVQRRARELITETDQLSRQAHAVDSDRAAEVFAALRTTLQRLERSLGGARHDREDDAPALAREVERIYERVKSAIARATPLRRETELLLKAAEDLRARVRASGRLASPAPHGAAHEEVLGALDRVATTLPLGAAVAGLAGLLSLASPFALGYWRRRPLTSAAQVVVGLSLLAFRGRLRLSAASRPLRASNPPVDEAAGNEPAEGEAHEGAREGFERTDPAKVASPREP